MSLIYILALQLLPTSCGDSLYECVRTCQQLQNNKRILIASYLANVKSQVGGLEQLLRKICGSLAAKCYTLFAG